MEPSVLIDRYGVHVRLFAADTAQNEQKRREDAYIRFAIELQKRRAREPERHDKPAGQSVKA